MNLAFGATWVPVPKNLPALVHLYHRHYSARLGVPISTRLRSGVSGAGESLCLVSPTGDAGFIWVRNTIERYDKQEGIICTFFRNESTVLSSALILEAETLAVEKWGENRAFTYVNATKVASGLPGNTFLAAGWHYIRRGKHRVRSKGGLYILEKCLKVAQ